MKIIIVDDDASILTILQIMLQRRGHDVLAYRNPLECPIYQAKSCPCPVAPPCPDIIISDFNMPKVNGVQFLEAVHQQGCQCTHSAILTGYGVPEQDMLRMARFGTRFFLKPVEFEELRAWLDRVAAQISSTIRASP